jgi:hypothetical protein
MYLFLILVGKAVSNARGNWNKARKGRIVDQVQKPRVGSTYQNSSQVTAISEIILELKTQETNSHESPSSGICSNIKLLGVCMQRL